MARHGEVMGGAKNILGLSKKGRAPFGTDDLADGLFFLSGRSRPDEGDVRTARAKELDWRVNKEIPRRCRPGLGSVARRTGAVRHRSCLSASVGSFLRFTV